MNVIEILPVEQGACILSSKIDYGFHRPKNRPPTALESLWSPGVQSCFEHIRKALGVTMERTPAARDLPRSERRIPALQPPLPVKDLP